MVYIRSTHVDKPASEQGDWLAQLASAEKAEKLREHADTLRQLCATKPQLLVKGQEMVETFIAS